VRGEGGEQALRMDRKEKAIGVRGQRNKRRTECCKKIDA